MTKTESAHLIAKNVPGVKAMVEDELTDAQYQDILRPVLSRLGMHRFLNGDEITLNPSDYRAIIKRACDFTRLAATTQASTAQAERDALLDAAESAASDAYINAQCAIERGEFSQPIRQTREAIEAAIRALRSAGDTGGAQ